VDVGSGEGEGDLMADLMSKLGLDECGEGLDEV
jgi:hypothetical protein